MSEERVRLADLPLRYPALFPKGPLTWGFEHGEGWTDLVAELCQNIDARLRQDPGARFRVKQVKEKFGALRFYYELHDASDVTRRAIRGLVDAACAESESICERCGRLATLTQRNGWLSTQCRECLEALERADEGDDDAT